MYFDPENPVVKLCAKGMEMEGLANPDKAAILFKKAWDLAASPFEKFTAAHYLARHQTSISEKLKWDTVALENALKIPHHTKAALPSLYLNIGKCHEDLGNKPSALENYKKAQSHTDQLDDDGYGQLLKNGIENGIKRVQL